jgi:dihydroorotate dehydrogenase (fumarate)/dihydroorotate dehydrogenase
VTVYKRLIRPILFRADPEWIHDRAIRTAQHLSPLAGVLSPLFEFTDERLAVDAAGMRFRHPVGLAAGFDKSGRAVTFWPALGFSHVEIGSVSAEPSSGNPRPRLFRIPEDHGIVVNYGLPNDGCRRVAERLSEVRRPVPLGINIVNTNRGQGAPGEPDEVIIGDYVQSVRTLQPVGDYLSLNLSCPNTKDGRGFIHDASRLRRLLAATGELGPSRPVFLKVAPFSGPREVEAFLAAVEDATWVRGFAINLPPGKPPGLKTSAERLEHMPGAVSGRPCEAAMNQTIAELYRRMDRRRFVIIGTGGVFTAEDAYRKIRLGATLVQLLTGLVYEGPGIVRTICEGLAEIAERDGLRHITDALGADVRSAEASRARVC